MLGPDRRYRGGASWRAPFAVWAAALSAAGGAHGLRQTKLNDVTLTASVMVSTTATM